MQGRNIANKPTRFKDDSSLMCFG